VDRAVLDEEVLRRAQALGAEVWRPATVGNIHLAPGGNQTIEVRRQASGRGARRRRAAMAHDLGALGD